MKHPHWPYCLEILPKVSRTFALNINILRGELHQAMLTVYLICRIIDTVEDAPTLDSSLKVFFLRNFPKIFTSANWEQELENWVDGLKEQEIDGRAADIALVANSKKVVSCFKQLPEGYQKAGEKLFKTMSFGMAEYIQRFPEGRVALVDLEDLRRYCYYVAGVVGEFLYEAFYLVYKVEDYRNKISKEDYIAYGLGLQMTNIAKDIFQDYERGQRFFPESLLLDAGLSKEEFLTEKKSEQMQEAYEGLLKEAYQQLLKGYSLTISLYRRHCRLRLFCIWPLWMAFETLKTLKKNQELLYSNKDVKIGRRDVKRIMFSTTLMIPGNFLIRRNFSKNYENMW